MKKNTHWYDKFERPNSYVIGKEWSTCGDLQLWNGRVRTDNYGKAVRKLPNKLANLCVTGKLCLGQFCKASLFICTENHKYELQTDIESTVLLIDGDYRDSSAGIEEGELSLIMQTSALKSSLIVKANICGKNTLKYTAVQDSEKLKNSPLKIQGK